MTDRGRAALAERIVDRMAASYRLSSTRAADIAKAIDESIDRSGNLLGWLRDYVYGPADDALAVTPREEGAGLRLRRIEEAARDVDALWEAEDGELIHWQVEAGEALEDLRAALAVTPSLLDPNTTPVEGDADFDATSPDYRCPAVALGRRGCICYDVDLHG
jgi:hypothetical protein